MIEARYVHTNLIARDWRSLATFYERVFGCRPVPPERDYAGRDLEAGTGIPGARLRGAHLILPGHAADAPTLEIYQYEPETDTAGRTVSTPGYGHIAFEVASVEEAHDQVLAAGGAPIGEIVKLVAPDGRIVTWCYVEDPEGNAIELQSWS
jgi:predicted enzyme related to lactoylglutathione lyase